MKIFRLGLIVVSLLIAPVLVADVESDREAERLLETMGMEEAMIQSMNQMIDLQLQQNPTMAPFKSVMMTFIGKHMSWVSLKPEFVKIYSEAFTTRELQDLNAFYATDTGKKTIQLMPYLMAQGSQIGMQRVQENMGELQEMIRIESVRLQELSAQ